MNKKISLGVALTIMLIAMAVTFSVTMAFSMNMFNNSVTSVKSRERMYNKLSEVDRYVRANEYFEINEDTLNDTIASGYVLGISDRYARYYSAQSYNELVGTQSGRLMGIGVDVVKDASSSYARIIRVYDNSPAAEIGLEEGGFITSIGETSLRSLADTSAIKSALLGEEGSTVTIGYLTPDRTEESYTITRANYTVGTVFGQMIGNNCAYIKIDDFAANTGTEFRSTVDSLRGQGAESFIFDLRNNAGTSLNAALIAADYCVPSGLIAQSQAKDGTTEDLRVSDDTSISQPMICLVNGSTAGGAELFANALRKMGGAALVGSATAGQGVVLSEPQSLSDGSAVVITVGLLLDNEGQSWDGTGLTPDVDDALTSDEQSSFYNFTVDTDPQIQRALTTLQSMAG
ncbi:MAG TPA: PDZ domain-containing protein [Candidatus Gemmiger faecigallinarum]|nr:PDZ domain-containing protein [Candidatus Gemmiger faecigallinarum]